MALVELFRDPSSWPALHGCGPLSSLAAFAAAGAPSSTAATAAAAALGATARVAAVAAAAVAANAAFGFALVLAARVGPPPLRDALDSIEGFSRRVVVLMTAPARARASALAPPHARSCAPRWRHYAACVPALALVAAGSSVIEEAIFRGIALQLLFASRALPLDPSAALGLTAVVFGAIHAVNVRGAAAKLMYALR